MSGTAKGRIGRGILEIGIFSAAINILLLVAPLYLLQVYDRVIPASSGNTLLYLTIAAVAAFIVLGVLDIVRGQYLNRVSNSLSVDAGTSAFLASASSRQAGAQDLQPLRDLVTLKGFLSTRAPFALFDLPFAPLFIAILYLIHPVLFQVTVAGAIILLVIAIINQAATARSGASSVVRTAAAMNAAQSAARNFEAMRALGMVRAVTDVWGTLFADSLAASDRFVSKNTFYSGLSRSLRLILQIAVLGAGAYLVLNNEITAGMIFAASIISSRALQPLDQIIGSWRQITDAARAWRRVRAVTTAVPAEPRRVTDLPAPRGNVSIEQLVYYVPNATDGSPPLIKRISLEVAAGEVLALAGPSGAGKSTLARLIVGAIAPHSGAIRFDGADIDQWNAEKLGAHIGYVPQNVELLPGTIAQNIARFQPDAADDEIVAAGQQARAHELILKLENGYDTQVGPEGVELSGGERQRIGIARALYRDPALLVLDEPATNLDAEGEVALREIIISAKERGATVLVITHKADLAAACDRVLLLREGQVEMIGPTREILRRLGQSAEDGSIQPVSDEKSVQVDAPTRATASFGQIVRVPTAGGTREIGKK